MTSVRLPLQVGRAAIAQGARFAATVWTGPILLLAGTACLQFGAWYLAMPVGFAGIVVVALAFDAASNAAADRPSDLLLEAGGFAIEGGPLDRTRCTWADVDAARCAIVEGEPRTSVRWLILKWLTAGRVGAIARRVRVPVLHLQLPRRGAKAEAEPLVLAEAEGDERGSLEQLRDSILSTAAPATAAAPPPAQEILRCPTCGAAQVPVDAPTMACAACGGTLAVPDELRERLRARAELELAGAPSAALVRRLVDQPGARHAARVVAMGRRLMVWIQPAALVGVIVFAMHQDGHVPGTDTAWLYRLAPSDDGVLYFDMGLALAIVLAAFAVAWALTAAYVSNRSALRILADQLGAVPPVQPGAPSTCRQCGAPLPASQALLVHCVYCATENVLGIDPRPAALRHRRDRIDLPRALRDRRRARLRVWIGVPLSAAVAVIAIYAVHLAWGVPQLRPNADAVATITNDDPWPRTVELDERGELAARATLVPHGVLGCYCQATCTLRVGTSRTEVKGSDRISLHIVHDLLRPGTPPPGYPPPTLDQTLSETLGQPVSL